MPVGLRKRFRTANLEKTAKKREIVSSANFRGGKAHEVSGEGR